MSQARDDFPKPVADALAKRAAFVCTNPDCHSLTVAPSDADEGKFLYIGVAAHICAASVGGPRYDPKMTSEERKSASNGIFLCSNCAAMIDKNYGLDFPVAVLRKWKEDHGIWVRANLNKLQIDQEANMIFNASSTGQSGGITAGVVNIGPQPRRLDDPTKTKLALFLPDKTRAVSVETVMGDSEAFSFAKQIESYLISQGYNYLGFRQSQFTEIIPPQSFDPITNTIIIGSKQ